MQSSLMACSISAWLRHITGVQFTFVSSNTLLYLSMLRKSLFSKMVTRDLGSVAAEGVTFPLT